MCDTRVPTLLNHKCVGFLLLFSSSLAVEVFFFSLGLVVRMGRLDFQIMLHPHVALYTPLLTGILPFTDHHHHHRLNWSILGRFCEPSSYQSRITIGMQLIIRFSAHACSMWTVQFFLPIVLLLDSMWYVAHLMSRVILFLCQDISMVSPVGLGLDVVHLFHFGACSSLWSMESQPTCPWTYWPTKPL